MSTVTLEDTIYFHFGTSDVNTGGASNADSTPVAVVVEDGVDMAYSPTITNIITGLYMITIDATTANGFEVGKRYSVYATATVNGVDGVDGIAEFEIAYTSIPEVDVKKINGVTVIGAGNSGNKWRA